MIPLSTFHTAPDRLRPSSPDYTPHQTDKDARPFRSDSSPLTSEGSPFLSVVPPPDHPSLKIILLAGLRGLHIRPEHRRSPLSTQFPPLAFSPPSPHPVTYLPIDPAE